MRSASPIFSGTKTWLPVLTASIGVGYAIVRALARDDRNGRMRDLRRIPLQPSIPGHPHVFHTRLDERLTYYVDGPPSSRSVVFLHSIHAGANAYEMLPLFDFFRHSRRAYALDLPGFGKSERKDRSGSADYYTETIASFLAYVNADEGPVDVVALSQSCEFAAAATFLVPDAVRSLVLLSPTGLANERTYFSPSYKPWVNNNFLTANVCDRLYKRIRVPTLVLFDEDAHTRFDRLPELLRANARICGKRIRPSHGMPHWDCPDQTVAAINALWRKEALVAAARPAAAHVTARVF